MYLNIVYKSTRKSHDYSMYLHIVYTSTFRSHDCHKYLYYFVYICPSACRSHDYHMYLYIVCMHVNHMTVTCISYWLIPFRIPNKLDHISPILELVLQELLCVCTAVITVSTILSNRGSVAGSLMCLGTTLLFRREGRRRTRILSVRHREGVKWRISGCKRVGTSVR